MADKNFFKTESGSRALPVNADGTFETDVINYDEGSLSEVYFEFYSDESLSNPVTPTGGTISVEASPLGNVYLSPAEPTPVNAVDVSSTSTATYTPPTIDGLVTKARVIVSGITGASYMRAVLFNHD